MLLISAADGIKRCAETTSVSQLLSIPQKMCIDD